jgi:surface antigen
MKTTAKAAALVMAGSLTLSACETNEQMGQMLGALAGAGLGAMVAGDDDDTMVAIAVLGGAAIGAWIGGNIGRGLDERERERLAVSTKQLLDQPVPSNSPLRYQSATNSPEAMRTAPSVDWTSPTNPQTVSGKTTLLEVTQNGQGECKTVRQLVVRNGQRTSEDARFCRANASSPWTQA